VGATNALCLLAMTWPNELLHRQHNTRLSHHGRQLVGFSILHSLARSLFSLSALAGAQVLPLDRVGVTPPHAAATGAARVPVAAVSRAAAAAGDTAFMAAVPEEEAEVEEPLMAESDRLERPGGGLRQGRSAGWAAPLPSRSSAPPAWARPPMARGAARDGGPGAGAGAQTGAGRYQQQVVAAPAAWGARARQGMLSLQQRLLAAGGVVPTTPGAAVAVAAVGAAAAPPSVFALEGGGAAHYAGVEAAFA
jgi:hypothetical protein